MTTMRSNTTAVFIGGAGHSGSTLLGLALGAHPHVFYAGEARKSTFFGNPKKPLRKRVCKVCGPDCAVWKDLALDAETDLYEWLSRKTGRPVVVDSTKSIEWIDEQSALASSRGAKIVLVFLSRDGRAVLGSGLRKYPDITAVEHAEKWRSQMEATATLAARFPGVVTHVRYEALATAPEQTLRSLADVIGLEFDPVMLEPFSTEQHPLGGNAGTQSLLANAQTKPSGALPISGSKKDYYGSHPKSFVLDLRWKREVPPAALEAFEATAGELNRTFAWDEEAP